MHLYRMKLAGVSITYQDYLYHIPAKELEGFRIIEEGLLARRGDDNEKLSESFRNSGQARRRA